LKFYTRKLSAYSVDFSLNFLQPSFGEEVFYVLVYTAETLLSLFWRLLLQVFPRLH